MTNNLTKTKNFDDSFGDEFDLYVHNPTSSMYSVIIVSDRKIMGLNLKILMIYEYNNCTRTLGLVYFSPIKLQNSYQIPM